MPVYITSVDGVALIEPKSFIADLDSDIAGRLGATANALKKQNISAVINETGIADHFLIFLWGDTSFDGDVEIILTESNGGDLFTEANIEKLTLGMDENTFLIMTATLKDGTLLGVVADPVSVTFPDVTIVEYGVKYNVGDVVIDVDTFPAT
jgi:hypothetical protein